jgi:type VI secretion system secreted protein Hcp
MAGVVFLKLDGISGESADTWHAGEIELLSWQWGVSAAHPAPDAEDSAPFTEINVTKVTDCASTELVKACLTRRVIPSARLTARQSSALDFIRVIMTDVYIGHVLFAQSGDGHPTESVTLGFRAFSIEYIKAREDGSPGASYEMSYPLA